MHLRPLRHRDFSLLWWAGLISLTGTWAMRVALPIYVLALTGSPASVAAVVAAALAGTILFGPVGGAYVDRWDRRRVVVAVNALLALTMLPLTALHDRRLWPVAVAVAFVEAALNQFGQPAENALLPRLVPADQLVAANALNGLNNNTGRLFGPALGGTVAATAGLTGAALLNAATFAVAAGLCALITGRHRARDTVPPRLLGDLVDGLRAAVGLRTVRAVAVLLAVTSVGEGVMSTLVAVFVTGPLGADSRALGAMMSAQAVGGVVGSLLSSRLAHRFRPVPLIAASYACFGVVDVLIFNCPRVGAGLWPVVALFGLAGVPVGVHVPVIWALFQRTTPDAVRGRAFAAIWTGAAVAGVVGAALAGWLGGAVDVLTLLTIQGIGPILAAALFRLIAGTGPAPETRTPEPLLSSAARCDGEAYP